MRSQWNCVLQNLGEWQGSFTHFSAQGEMLQDIPSLISLQGINQNQTIHLALKRFYPIQPGSSELQPKELVMDFSAPSAGALFFESGAFSEGGIYFSPCIPFVAEFCLLSNDQTASKAERRSRLVQLFNADSQLYQITLIREQRAGTLAPEQSPLVLEDLLGEWRGKAVTLYPNQPSNRSKRFTPEIYDSTFSLYRTSASELVQQFYTHEDDTFHSAIATCQGAIIGFNGYEQSYQTLLLPDGASSTCPTQIQPKRPFFLEAGWLRSPHIRQRLIRRYNSEGHWISVTWITEHRVN